MSQSRGQWSGKLGFILAAAGSAVGLGNLWKFPYITYENNGGAFVLVYIAAIALVGLPIMMAETLIGRKTQLNAVGAFNKLGGKLWSPVGFLGVLAGFVILSYYSVVAGWTLRYIVMSLSGELGNLAAIPQDLDTFFGDYTANGTQQIIGLSLFMTFTTTAVIFGVKRGIERVSKILMPILLLILASLAIYATTTAGFDKAMHFLFHPDFSTLSRGAVLEAMGHAFFTLSLGMGCILTYGSYMRKTDSIPNAAMQITLLDTLVAILACVVMFSIIFSNPDMQISKSAGILFTTLPTVFVKMPGGNFIMTMFYFLVAFAALTSTISLLEVISSYSIDELKWSRKRAALTVAFSVFIFGSLNALSLGAESKLSSFNLFGKETTVGMFGTMDYLASNWLLPVGGLLIALFTGWVLSVRGNRAELEEGHGDLPAFPVWLFLIRFVAPIAVGAIVVSVILGAEYQ
ncbi:MAG: sodium-dependent transporter [bacterium]|nr:sodium-dependent transporter [bacterium]